MFFWLFLIFYFKMIDEKNLIFDKFENNYQLCLKYKVFLKTYGYLQNLLENQL